MTCEIGVTTPVTAGNLILVTVSGTANVASVYDSVNGSGHPYTQVYTESGVNYWTFVFMLKVPAGGSNFTVSATGVDSAPVMNVAEFSAGAGETYAVEGTPTYVTLGTTGAISIPALANTAGDLVYVPIPCINIGSTFTPGSGAAALAVAGTVGSGYAICGEYYLSATANLAATATLNAVYEWSGAAVAIKATVAPTTATLSGPSTGKIGAASSVFTITLNSATSTTLSFPITYAGGTASPNPVVITSGPTGTFTVTPTSSGASNVTLGAGTTGLTIAGSPISYTATASTATLSGPASGLIAAASAVFTVTLDAVAPSGGVSCPVASSDGNDTVSSSPVAIAAGQITGTFTVTPAPHNLSDTGSRNITLGTTTPILTIAGSPHAYLVWAVYPVAAMMDL